MVYSRAHTVTLGRKSAWDIQGRSVNIKILIKKYVCRACMTILCAGLDVGEVAHDYATAVS